MHRCAHLALISLILLGFFLTLAGAVPAHAASSRYVATTGDDTGNDCLSALNPCVTIAYAISQAASGDTLEIAAGTYTEAGITVNKDLTITGATAPSTIVQAAASAGVATNSVFQISSGFTITIKSMTIRYGNASGGINTSGTLTLNHVIVSDNQSSGDGGGIRNEGDLTVLNSFFSGNTAQFGGGIANDTGKHLMVSNSTLSDNSAAFSGGGIYNVGTLTMINSTLSGNTSKTDSGGLRNGPTATMHLKNNLIANSNAPGDCSNSGSLATNISNLIESGSCGATLSGDPQLASLDDYGGDTPTFALLPGSLAIDTGDNATCQADPVSGLDQRGIARPAACDIGAFESQGFTISISGGNNQRTRINTAFTDPLQVTFAAVDPNLTMTAGQVITFTAPISGASLSTTSFTATTNAGGVASASVTANGTAGSYQVTATAAGASNSVSFTLAQYLGNTLIVSVAGTGSGTVTSSPGGISCGSDCSEIYDSDAIVTLTATADTGSMFTGWSGACSGAGTCMLTLEAARNVTATFMQQESTTQHRVYLPLITP